MKRKIIVFDLDDTLYKEVEFLQSAYREISSWLEKSYGKKNVYEYMLSCYKKGLNVFACVNNEYNLKFSLDAYLDRYRMHMPEISLAKDVEDSLISMCENDCILGIITDGRSITQSNKITALGLNRYISWENCIISETFGYSKPCPQAFLYFQNKYIDADFYYIGDNVIKDFIAPNQLGWITICVKDDGRNIHKQTSVTKELKPKYEIVRFSELLNLVEKNF